MSATVTRCEGVDMGGRYVEFTREAGTGWIEVQRWYHHLGARTDET